MSILIDKPEFASHIIKSLMFLAEGKADEGTHAIDGAKLLMGLAGLVTETLLLFDESDECLGGYYSRLAHMLQSEALPGVYAQKALPPSYIVDYETERGRELAKQLFADWLECAYEFYELILFVSHSVIMMMEREGHPRSESFRFMIEMTNKSMGYELAAQELCDIVIEKKIGKESWKMADTVSGLSAIAGRAVALSNDACELFASPSLPDKLDQIAYVMTQEAVRLGVPAGTDWRFGLAANDCNHNAPYDLISSLWPDCNELFYHMGIHDLVDQSVACAKAAGRMLAIMAGGEVPEMEPVIAKPLAMAAMTDTYKTVCFDQAAMMR